MTVDKTDYDDKIQNFKVRRFELDDSIQMATETSLDLVASLQVCSWLCLNSTTTNAWTWDPSTLVCNCVSLLEEYHCQNYFLNELSLDDDSASKTVYIKRRLVYLKKYCTSKLLHFALQSLTLTLTFSKTNYWFLVVEQIPKMRLSSWKETPGAKHAMDSKV